jgi:hypothetical protein
MKPVPVYVGKIFEEVSSAERGARGREDKQRGEECTRRWSPSQTMFALSDLRMQRLGGANHLWRRVPPSELSIELVANGRRGRATGSVEAP